MLGQENYNEKGSKVMRKSNDMYSKWWMDRQTESYKSISAYYCIHKGVHGRHFRKIKPKLFTEKFTFNNFQRMQICCLARINTENLLCVPDQPRQVARKNNLLTGSTHHEHTERWK